MDEDRLKHSMAVARKMVEIGKKYNLSEQELEDLFTLSVTEWCEKTNAIGIYSKIGKYGGIY